MKFPKAVSRTGVVFFPAFDWSISPTHPEREERLLYTRDQIFEEGLFDIEGIVEYLPAIATVKDIERVHAVFPSTKRIVTPSHFISAGGAIEAARSVMDGEVKKAFALVRPPGHHAMRVVYGLRGFCVVNIEAVMIEHLRKKYGPLRVAVIDTDCHHGDGTQDIYWNDPDTLFVSLHQDGRTLYPGSGFPGEFGGPGGYGATINVPLPPGTNDEGYLYVLDNLVLPILEEWKPDLIINSAGQDNHFSDPITNMAVTAEGYASITRKLNPDVAVLEGGYSIQSALPYVNMGILLAMAGLDTSRVIEPDFHPGVLKLSEKTAEYLKRLCELLLARFRGREELAIKEFGSRIHHETSYVVYHDETGISEERSERVRVCPDCRGVSLMSSRAPGRGSVFIANVPLGACPVCTTEGFDSFEAVRDSDYDLALLQDRPKDEVEKKGRLACEGDDED
ncbi:histone deacetylase [bacterium]|nr:MAG: histone deacetylase [bacterium]